MLQRDSKAEIELHRGGRLVSTLTGAFGQSIRETRLTALLGYIIAIDPSLFMDLLKFKGIAQKVSLETRHEDGRSDILIETNCGVGVIEAKVNAADPLHQARKYKADWTVLLTHHIPVAPPARNFFYISWQQLAHRLQDLSRSRRPELRVLAADLLTYLEEHRMIKQRVSVEVYAREINELTTLNLFLKAQIYTCKYEASSRVAEAWYFAPHFGQRIAGNHAGLGIGISHISRIHQVGHAGPWADLKTLLIQQLGRNWWNRHSDLFSDIRSKWKAHPQHTVLFLGTPRLVFNPPIHKESLQKGKGFLSKRVFSFDELFEGWGI